MIKKIVNILILSMALISCHKNSPKPGKYWAVFTGTAEVTGAVSTEIGYITISETTKDAFYIGDAKVDKFGKNVIGEIGEVGNLAGIKIKGVCQKKKGKYYITGTYKAAKVDYEGGIINGKFEIKSN